MSASTGRTQPADVRREQILDAAARVLVAKGLAEATIADVAADAGIAKGTVYLYFESKAQLLTGLQARYNGDLALRTARLVEGRGDRLARLDAFLSELVDYHESQFALHHVLFHEAALSEPESTGPLVALFKRFVEDGVASGEFSSDDPEFSAVFLLSGLHGVLIPYLHHRTVSRRRFLKQLRDVARRTLVPSGDG